jgi:hypothetical protein
MPIPESERLLNNPIESKEIIMKEFESTRTLEPQNNLLKEEKQEKVAMLFRAALCPREFNNETFWGEIYKSKNENNVLERIKDLNYKLGREIPRDILFTVGSIDYVVCWPDIEDLVKALQPHFQQEDLKALLLNCLLDKNTKHQNNFSTYLDTLLQNYKCNPEKKSDDRTHDDSNEKSSVEHSYHWSAASINGHPNIHHCNASGFLGNQIKAPQPNSSALMLKILAGFIAAAGALAVVLAFTLLCPPITIPVILLTAAGATALGAGIGLFSAADKIAPVKMQLNNPPIFNP